jgi:hypothetical protein
MDGIHSRVQLLIYDKLPLVHGGLHTSGFVPPLLAGKLGDCQALWLPGHACCRWLGIASMLLFCQQF